MPGTLANFLEIKWLDHFLKVTIWNAPTDLFVTLSITDPTDSGAGLAEPSGGNFSRKIHNAWAPASSRATSNVGSITFPDATASWGTITHWAIMDAASGGNMLAHGDLSASKVIDNGDTFIFAANDLDITVTANGMSDFMANIFLDHFLKTAAYTPASAIFLALTTLAITDSMTGSTITEPGAGAYARKQHDSWNAASGGHSDNNGDITFIEATASWGNIGWFALVDAATAGNILCHAAVGTAKAIDNGDTAEFVDGLLDINLD